MLLALEILEGSGESSANLDVTSAVQCRNCFSLFKFVLCSYSLALYFDLKL